jgi:hypothetical protein
MKKTTEPLIDDLLEDAIPPEFRAALLDKTLQGARQRKRGRRLNLALGATALAGIFTLAFWEMRVPTMTPNQIHRPVLSAANLHKSSPVLIVSTKRDAVEKVVASDPASALTMVQTTESARPREINDQQLLALLSDRPVALVRQGAHEAELIFPNSEDEKGVPVR